MNENLNREQTIRTFTEHLEEQKPFAFIKFGDDTVFCMSDMEGTNGEGHHYLHRLGVHLREAYSYAAHNGLYVGEWEDPRYTICQKLRIEASARPIRVFFDALLLHDDAYLTEDIRQWYRLLRDDSRPKFYFARERMRQAAKDFKMAFIPISYPNAYDSLQEAKKSLKTLPRGSVALFSCGMLSKILVYEGHKLWNDLTLLDMGSAFDPLYVGSTRSQDEQQHVRVREYFQEFLHEIV